MKHFSMLKEHRPQRPWQRTGRSSMRRGFFSEAGIYPFPETFIRFGTGFNGTVAGQNLGPVTDIPVETRSATYHGDGYLYADIFLSKEVLRIRPETGEADRVAVPDGLSAGREWADFQWSVTHYVGRDGCLQRGVGRERHCPRRVDGSGVQARGGLAAPSSFRGRADFDGLCLPVYRWGDRRRSVISISSNSGQVWTIVSAS